MGRTLSRIRHWGDSNNAFTFEKLPEVCQLKIFGFLTVTEKGIAAQVCKYWNSLLKSPVLWTYLDLTVFKLHLHEEHVSKKHVCNSNCYRAYKARMNSFHMFIVNISPSVHLLKFAFDIGNAGDGWLDWMRLLLAKVRCRDLTDAFISWKDTAVGIKDSASCSEEDAEFASRARHRQRLFVGFFEYFVSLAPNLSRLDLEFDWSVRSVDALSTLSRLETLVLRRYSVFQMLDQELMDRLLDSLPCLTHLTLEVWTPNSTGLCQFFLKSNSVQHLDISPSRGFSIACLDLPRVQTIKMSCHPWNGPLATVNCAPLPCVYHSLVRGAPDLREINGHLLRPGWKRRLYTELTSVLDAVCPCHLHAAIPTSCVK